jgi:hypothetical protein
VASKTSVAASNTSPKDDATPRRDLRKITEESTGLSPHDTSVASTSETNEPPKGRLAG